MGSSGRLVPFRCLGTCLLSNHSNLVFLDRRATICSNCDGKTLRRINLIHLVKSDKSGYIIFSHPFEAERRSLKHEFLCDKGRSYWDKPEHPYHPRLYTSAALAATCPECLKRYGVPIEDGDMFNPREFMNYGGCTNRTSNRTL